MFNKKIWLSTYYCSKQENRLISFTFEKFAPRIVLSTFQRLMLMSSGYAAACLVYVFNHYTVNCNAFYHSCNSPSLI